MKEIGVRKVDQVFEADWCSALKAYRRGHVPRKSAVRRQERQARKVYRICCERIAEPDPHDAVVLHHRIAPAGVGIFALVARYPFVRMEFTGDHGAVLAPEKTGWE